MTMLRRRSRRRARFRRSKRGCVKARISRSWRRISRKIRIRPRMVATSVLSRNPHLIRRVLKLAHQILQVPPGQISRPVESQGSYRIFKVSVEGAGRPARTELIQKSSSESVKRLLNRKDQLLKAAYYEVARNEAKVVNHYRSELTRSSAKK